MIMREDFREGITVKALLIVMCPFQSLRDPFGVFYTLLEVYPI